MIPSSEIATEVSLGSGSWLGWYMRTTSAPPSYEIAARLVSVAIKVTGTRNSML